MAGIFKKFTRMDLLLIPAFAVGLTIIILLIMEISWHAIGDFLSNNPLIVFLALASVAAGVWQTAARRTTGWKPEERDVILIALILVAAVMAGFYLVSALRHLAVPQSQAAAARIATLWAAAYCAAGFMGGFLFGIPRVLQRDEPGGKDGAYTQRVNTNLEQISDWLTKIIVGLGLVQLRKVPDYLGRASEWMAQSFTPNPGVDHWQIASISNSIIVLYTVLGFLSGYLITRLYLSGAFRRADQSGDGSVAAAGGKSNEGVSKDAAATRLRQFWKPDGTNPDAESEKRLLAWLIKMGISTDQQQVPIPSFINLPAYATQREAAVKELL